MKNDFIIYEFKTTKYHKHDRPMYKCNQTYLT